MKIKLQSKPLSVNKAWRGAPRYRTDEYDYFAREVFYQLPREKISGEIEIHYKFHIKNYKATDVSNLIKCLEDVMVNSGLIDDDRMVVRFSAEKIKSNNELDHIEIEIIKL